MVQRIASDPGVLEQESLLRTAIDSWWKSREAGIAELGTTRRLMELRTDLLSTFESAVRPVGLLDRFEVAGVIASWWGETQTDLKTIAARGFVGLGLRLGVQHSECA